MAYTCYIECEYVLFGVVSRGIYQLFYLYGIWGGGVKPASKEIKTFYRMSSYFHFFSCCSPIQFIIRDNLVAGPHSSAVWLSSVTLL